MQVERRDSRFDHDSPRHVLERSRSRERAARARTAMLTNADVRRIAVAVADELEARRSPSNGALLTAAQKAQQLGVTTGYVYAHADELGAIRLPSGGRKPRLRYPATATPGDVGGGSPAAQAAPARRSRRCKPPSFGADGTTAPLLPIKGRSNGPRGRAS
jgi:hypothetical protein